MKDKPYKVALGPAVDAKLLPGDPRWSTFNSSFVNREVTALELNDALEAGHPITTWLTNGWRKTGNYQLGQHLALDFDTRDQRSDLNVLVADPFVWRYAAVLYTTPSHTPDAPRARVVFLLDTPIHQAKNYVDAATALMWMFGFADRQCKDAARFFFGGKPGACEAMCLDRELPLDLVKDLIARHKTTSVRERRAPNPRYAGQTPDEQRVQDALKALNPWKLDYGDWLAVLLALHSEFPGANGLAMAESWAQGFPGEVEGKWRGFKSNGNGAGRVGIGTLFALAKEAGWAG